MHDGGFREDLFHRLNVFRIRVPPLRERREDIAVLLAHYLARRLPSWGSRRKLAPDAESCLLAFDWPGNVRQLVNACRRLTLLAPGERIELRDLPRDLGGADTARRAPSWSSALAQWAEARLAAGRRRPLLDGALPELERTLIRSALEHTRRAAPGSRAAARAGAQHAHAQAAQLGWTDHGGDAISRRTQLHGSVRRSPARERADERAHRVHVVVAQIRGDAGVDLLADQRIVEQRRADADGAGAGDA